MQTLSRPSLSYPERSVEPGRFELPQLRRVGPNGYGAIIPPAEATSEERSEYVLALYRFQADVSEATEAALGDVSRVILRDMNAALRGVA
jgi:hypothetical protein